MKLIFGSRHIIKVACIEFQKIVTAVEFHKTAQVILVAGYDQTLNLFQVSLTLLQIAKICPQKLSYSTKRKNPNYAFQYELTYPGLRKQLVLFFANI